MKLARYIVLASSLAGAAACGNGGGGAKSPDGATEPGPSTADGGGPTASARPPLTLVADVALPGGATRFDYQDVDREHGHLIVAHMNDGTVLVVDLADGKPVKTLPNVPTARGIVVAPEIGRFFVTSSPNQLVVFDSASLTEVGRVTTGNAPDGVGWDPVHRVVGVSDQRDGAVSLLADGGTGARTAVKVGVETGNVVFDPKREAFWVTAVSASPPDQLVRIDPAAGTVAARIDLPGCDGAHGLRIAPDGASAFIACEGNDMLARVDLEGAHAIATTKTGAGPDVLAVDAALGWIYVAAESGDLTIVDMTQPGVVAIDREHAGDHAHSVAVDPATHRVFFPLMLGSGGKPVLRIMQPSTP